MAVYDTIGKTYAQTRNSDQRIATKLLEILQLSTRLFRGCDAGRNINYHV